MQKKKMRKTVNHKNMILKTYLPALALTLIIGMGVSGQPFSTLPSGENYKPAIEIKEGVQADFAAADTFVIKGQPLAFTNLSSGNPTFFKWYFEGATPSISYIQSPVIQYSLAGLFDVELIVAGLNGSDTLLKEDYIHVVPEQSGIPPGWEYSPSITQHTIVITLESNPRIFEEPIQPGDYIGVFYEDDNNELKCGGAVEWTGNSNTAVVAQGDNFFTGEKDGFITGEQFNWMFYSWDKAESFPAKAGYDPNMQLSIFVPDAISVVLDLHAGTVSQITFPEGWSGISSFVLPWESSLEELFAPHLNDIEIISNGEGFFQPEENINTLGNWENEGYLVKMKNTVVVDFAGYPAELMVVQVDEGWNIIHVPVSCGTDVNSLFQGHLSNIEIIQEIAGQKVFWPAKNIGTLQMLAKGKAYFLKASAAFTFQFAPCD